MGLALQTILKHEYESKRGWTLLFPQRNMRHSKLGRDFILENFEKLDNIYRCRISNSLYYFINFMHISIEIKILNDYKIIYIIHTLINVSIILWELYFNVDLINILEYFQVFQYQKCHMPYRNRNFAQLLFCNFFFSIILANLFSRIFSNHSQK